MVQHLTDTTLHLTTHHKNVKIGNSVQIHQMVSATKYVTLVFWMRERCRYFVFRLTTPPDL